MQTSPRPLSDCWVCLPPPHGCSTTGTPPTPSRVSASPITSTPTTPPARCTTYVATVKGPSVYGRCRISHMHVDRHDTTVQVLVVPSDTLVASRCSLVSLVSSVSCAWICQDKGFGFVHHVSIHIDNRYAYTVTPPSGQTRLVQSRQRNDGEGGRIIC